MLLIVEPGTLAFNLRAYRKFELVGPDSRGFFSLSLAGDRADREVLAISRSRTLAEGVLTRLFQWMRASNPLRDLDWPDLVALYRHFDGEHESPRIEVQDLEPSIRLSTGGTNGPCLDTVAAEALIAAMTAGVSVPGLWEPPLLRFGQSGGRRLQTREVPSFIARLEAAVAHVRDCAAAGTSTATTKPNGSLG